MTVYAKCPDGVDSDYLTPGKLYEVISDDGRLFSIKDDDGDCIRPSWNSSSHIEGKNWERIEETEGVLTLRDQFAMAAPPRPDWYYPTRSQDYSAPVDVQFAQQAEDMMANDISWRYHYADAMLKARKVNNEAD